MSVKFYYTINNNNKLFFRNTFWFSVSRDLLVITQKQNATPYVT